MHACDFACLTTALDVIDAALGITMVLTLIFLGWAGTTPVPDDTVSPDNL